MHTETPLEPAEILRNMPRNKDLQTLINEFRQQRRESIYPDTYGNAVVYSELQQAIPIPIQQNNLFTHFLSYSPKKALLTYAVGNAFFCVYLLKMQNVFPS